MILICDKHRRLKHIIHTKPSDPTRDSCYVSLIQCPECKDIEIIFHREYQGVQGVFSRPMFSLSFSFLHSAEASVASVLSDQPPLSRGQKHHPPSQITPPLLPHTVRFLGPRRPRKSAPNRAPKLYCKIIEYCFVYGYTHHHYLSSLFNLLHIRTQYRNSPNFVLVPTFVHEQIKSVSFLQKQTDFFFSQPICIRSSEPFLTDQSFD